MKDLKTQLNKLKYNIDSEFLNEFYKSLGVKIDIDINKPENYTKNKVYFNEDFKNKMNNSYTRITLHSYHTNVLLNEETKINSSNFKQIFKNLLNERKDIKKENKTDYYKLKLILNKTIGTLLSNNMEIKMENPNIFKHKFQQLSEELNNPVAPIIYADADEFVIDNYDYFKSEINNILQKNKLNFEVENVTLKLLSKIK